MAVTPSTMLALGTKAAGFSLPDTEGKNISLEMFQDQPLLVMFLSNHCPYVKHLRSGLSQFAKQFSAKGLAIVGINSNDVVKYPDDSPAKMVVEKKLADYIFPYLFDETQDVAKAYSAACTPDFFLFDNNHRLVYRGQFDDSRPGNNLPVTGKDLRSACDALLAGEKISENQRPSVGCNIKWK